jgi:hypothetical protein
MNKKHLQRGSSLLGVMASGAIVLILICVLFFGSKGGLFGVAKSTRKDKLGTTVPGAVRYDALDDVCRHNLSQIRMAIEIYQDSDGGNPPSLSVLKLPADMLCDPIDHKPYSYDPTTGIVKCTHPGHEKF